MKTQRTPNPEDRTTFERDFDEARFMRQILAAGLVLAMIGVAIWRSVSGA